MDSKSVLEIIHARAAEVSSVAVRDPTPNLDRFKERKATIVSVGQFLTNITTAVEALKKDYNNLKALHADETNMIKQVIDDQAVFKQVAPEPAPIIPAAQPKEEWITIARKNRPAKQLPQATSKNTPVTVKEWITLDAIHVDKFDQVKADGELYFVAPAGHFAIKIGNTLFHGNVGTIYDDEPILSRTADCKYVNGCTRETCDFYHNPMRFPDTSNVRNYHNSMFSYSPAKSKKYGHMRHFGSYSNLTDDIAELTANDAVFMRDQAFHELLCAMVASKYAQ